MLLLLWQGKRGRGIGVPGVRDGACGRGGAATPGEKAGKGEICVEMGPCRRFPRVSDWLDHYLCFLVFVRVRRGSSCFPRHSQGALMERLWRGGGNAARSSMVNPSAQHRG